MPLRAEIAGTSILSFELSPADWLMLKRQLRTNRSISRLPCCSAQAVAKTSKLGTQFFAHYVKNACDTGGETEAHLLAKRALYEGCCDAGWEALTEAASPDGAWRADVLASRDGAQVAFEIQWSPQTGGRTMERQRGFSQRNVRCVWLFRRLPFGKPARQVPAFALREEPGVTLPSVFIGERPMPLRAFAKAILEDRIQFRSRVSVLDTPVRCRIRRNQCPSCSAVVYFADVAAPPLVSPCGISLTEAPKFVAIQRVYADWSQELESVYAEHVALTVDGSHVTANLILKSPPEKPFMTAAGRSGFCPSCFAVVPITPASGRLPAVRDIDVPVRSPAWPNVPFPHWCLGNEGTYCQGA